MSYEICSMFFFVRSTISVLRRSASFYYTTNERLHLGGNNSKTRQGMKKVLINKNEGLSITNKIFSVKIFVRSTVSALQGFE